MTPKEIKKDLIEYWNNDIKTDLITGLIQKEEDIRARINHLFFSKFKSANYRIYNEMLLGEKGSRTWKLFDTVILNDEKGKENYYPSIVIEYKNWSTDISDINKFAELIKNYSDNDNDNKISPDYLIFFYCLGLPF